jgi:predicted phage terminase large subunit-like protein
VNALSGLSQLSEMENLEMGLQDAQQLMLKLERDRLRGSLYEFVKAAWKIVEPSQAFTDNWHVRVICTILEQVTFGQHKRVIINIPPGLLKSLLVSVFWPAWLWARNPKYRVLTAAYGAHLTIRDNLRVRDIILSPWFQELWPLQLVEDQNTKTRFNTGAKGWRIATSVNGIGTGEHPDIIIIDDPTTVEQAKSKVERERANAWFDGTISSRGITRPDLAIVIIQQRQHPDDLTGHLVKKDAAGWFVVSWPMRYSKARPKTEEDPDGYTPDPLDPRTDAGQLLFPALIPEVKVRQLELDLGPFDTAAQLQQQPSIKVGTLFKRGMFKFLKVMPKAIVRAVRGWDTAGTEDGGDWTVGVRIVETDAGQYIVTDAARGQLNAAGVDSLMKMTAKMDGPTTAQREEKEGGSAGKAVCETRAKTSMLGFDYAYVPISGDKVTRAKPFRSQVEAGNVFLLEGAWNKEYLDVLCAFPNGDHDDDVDGSSCAFNALLTEPRRKPVSLTW